MVNALIKLNSAKYNLIVLKTIKFAEPKRGSFTQRQGIRNGPIQRNSDDVTKKLTRNNSGLINH